MDNEWALDTLELRRAQTRLLYEVLYYFAPEQAREFDRGFNRAGDAFMMAVLNEIVQCAWCSQRIDGPAAEVQSPSEDGARHSYLLCRSCYRKIFRSIDP